jgi:hypothetical protein
MKRKKPIRRDGLPPSIAASIAQFPSGGASRFIPPGSQWSAGDKLIWNGYSGTFLSEAGNGDVEVLIGNRSYRVPLAEVRGV